MVYIMFVRHPETEGNADKKIIWSADIPLSKKWENDVSLLIQHVQNHIPNRTKPVNIFTNTLQRCWIVASQCRETLELLDFRQWVYQIEPNLLERDFGILHNKTKREIFELFSDYKDNFDILLMQEGLGFESTQQVRKRVEKAIYKIKTYYPNDNNIIFSNSSVWRSIISILLNHQEEDFERLHNNGPRNCEIRERTSDNKNTIKRTALLV